MTVFWSRNDVILVQKWLFLGPEMIVFGTGNDCFGTRNDRILDQKWLYFGPEKYRILVQKSTVFYHVFGKYPYFTVFSAKIPYFTSFRLKYRILPSFRQNTRVFTVFRQNTRISRISANTRIYPYFGYLPVVWLYFLLILLGLRNPKFIDFRTFYDVKSTILIAKDATVSPCMSKESVKWTTPESPLILNTRYLPILVENPPLGRVS